MTTKLNLNLKELKDDHIPNVYDTPSSETKDIIKSKLSPVYSYNGLGHPLIKYSFMHFIHQSKDKTEVFNKFKGKKKVYYVMNPFERDIEDYDNDIESATKLYFNIGSKPEILSRAFFKLWELLLMFDLVQIKDPNLVTAHLAEGPGSFIQATMFYRDMFTKKDVSKHDKYFAITLCGENKKANIPQLASNFIKYYKKEKPERFIQHETFPRSVADKSPTKDCGDLTDIKTIELFTKNFSKKKADFVTADGGFEWVAENVQEQEAFPLILGQVITALKIQAKSGNFVCKIYECYTNPTIKLILILKSVYNKVYITKPLMSRSSNSEKYLICLGYKGESAVVINMLEKLLLDIKSNEKGHLIDFFPEYNTDLTFNSVISQMNSDLSNKQFIVINKMITFIEKQNYRGDVYQSSRKEQIEASHFWINTFLPDNASFKLAKTSLEDFVTNIVEESSKRVNKLNKHLE